MFEEQAALAASAEGKLADELFVSGALAGGALDMAKQFAIGHMVKVASPAQTRLLGGLRQKWDRYPASY